MGSHNATDGLPPFASPVEWDRAAARRISELEAENARLNEHLRLRIQLETKWKGRDLKESEVRAWLEQKAADVGLCLKRYVQESPRMGEAWCTMEQDE